MDFNEKRAKSAGINTGAALLGAVAAHALTKKASDAIIEKSPDSKIGQHLPAIVLVACIGVQAMGIAPAGNDMVESALLGASVVSGMAAVREYSGANDQSKNTAGLAQMVNQYVPALNGLGDVYSTYQEYPQSLVAGGQNMMLGLPAAPVAASRPSAVQAFAA